MNFHHLQYWQQRAQALKIEHQLFIDGRYQPAAAGKSFAVEDPAGRRELAQIARVKPPTSIGRSARRAPPLSVATGRRPPRRSVRPRCCASPS